MGVALMTGKFEFETLNRLPNERARDGWLATTGRPTFEKDLGEALVTQTAGILGLGVSITEVHAETVDGSGEAGRLKISARVFADYSTL